VSGPNLHSVPETRDEINFAKLAGSDKVPDLAPPSWAESIARTLGGERVVSWSRGRLTYYTLIGTELL
jgi:hypothetical protein